MPADAATSSQSVSDLQRRIDELSADLRTRIAELDEARRRGGAVAEILQVINASPGTLEPVFEAMLEKAMTLCGATFGFLTTYDGRRFTPAAVRGLPAALAEYFAAGMDQPRRGDAHARLLEGEDLIHNLDQMDEEAYRSGSPLRRAVVDLGGARTALVVALRKEGVLRGSLTVYRTEVRAFSDDEVVLVQSFATQAVIAIENARLLTEQREALERQTATAEVLRIISGSPGRLEPVFEAVLTNAVRISGGTFGMLALMDGGGFQGVATYAVGAEYSTTLSRIHDPPPGTGLDQLRRTLRTIEVSDCAAEPAYDSVRRLNPAFAAVRTALHIPMLRDAELLGAILIYRKRVEPFQPDEIDLVENFARQAVIAIENARLLSEQREALERQTATAEVLEVINASPGNLAPVFDAMLKKAMRLCESDFGFMNSFDGSRFKPVAQCGVPSALQAYFAAGPDLPGPGEAHTRVLAGEDLVHSLDYKHEDAYRLGNPLRRAVVDLGGARTALVVALRREGLLLGTMTIYRREIRPFSDKQIALLQGFAAQAVVAMENARLLGELRQRTDDLTESLEYQTATSEVLEVIGRSTSDIQPVLDTMLKAALRLCRTESGGVAIQHGDSYRYVATIGWDFEADKAFRNLDIAAGRSTVAARVIAEGRIVQVADVASDPEFGLPEMAERSHWHTALGVPLMRNDRPIGVIAITRDRIEPFTDRQVALVKTFADQAVIAIENARLLDELRQRQAELARSVDELTATGDVLKVISRSSVDLKTVLETLVERVARLCSADQAYMFRSQDELHHLVAAYGVSPEGEEFVRNHPFVPERGTVAGRVTLERRPIHIVDVLEDPDYTYKEGQAVTGFRTMLGIPLLREETLVGVFVLSRTHVDPFTSNEIELVTSFADQAVIAIENARLFEEIRQRQSELRVTFDNMGDGVAMFDADLRLAAWNRNFQKIIGLSDANLAGRLTYAEYLRLLAERGEFGTEDVEAALASRLESTDKELRLERTRPDGAVIEVRRNAVPGGGVVLIYSDITARKRSEEQIRAARDLAETRLQELKTAQSSLIHAEKMASLGQLTAGIAHEIKNPLNFVNNFAGLSVELLDELRETMTPLRETLDAERRTEIDETIELLNTNLDKIASHGRRADGIVRSMLLHSRGGSGDRQSVDINAVLEEALNLAYHGARAQDQNFNVILERELQPDIPAIEIVPQDVTRVFLNLIGNGFYAVARRAQQDSDAAFRRTLRVRTRDLGTAVEIAIRDNGTGISPEHQARLFQPFFTTKPTGEGTGLGLSISYDIVTQQHSGTIEVESAPGQFTEFTVRLPRRGPKTEGRPA